MKRQAVVFFLNGQRCEVGTKQASMMLSEYLRTSGLTGTKVVCAEGDCGACSVLRLFPGFGSRTKQLYQPINSCITSVAQMDGSSLITIDSLAEEKEGSLHLTPAQESMVHSHASQCGFCTPGFVIALTGLVEKKLAEKNPTPSISIAEAKNCFTGNLCRCTGYQPIIDAATSLALSQCKHLTERFYSRAQERELREILEKPVHLEDETFSFYAPTQLRDAVHYLKKHPETRLIAAGTDLGVLINKRKLHISHFLSLHLIPELYEIKPLKLDGQSRLKVGARATLQELRQQVRTRIPELAQFIDIFASPQIKNVATLIGNLANASPIGETPPFLLATDAVIELIGPKGKRSVVIDEFFRGYRQTALKKAELITAVHFAIPGKLEKLSLRKISQRRDLDISAINAAFRLIWKDPKKRKIDTVRLAVGGMAATPVRLKQLEANLAGKTLDSATVEMATQLLASQSELTPLDDVRGTAAFRRVLLENLLRRFLMESMS